jgi:hypothetical protein
MLIVLIELDLWEIQRELSKLPPDEFSAIEDRSFSGLWLP